MGRTLLKNGLRAYFLYPALLIGGFYVLACGAKAVDDGESHSQESMPQQEVARDNSTSDNSSSTLAQQNNGSANENSGGFGKSDLPPCELGEPFDGSSTCFYLGDGRCYEKQIEACACVCPQRSDSVCTSGFPSPTGSPPTEVFCK